MLFPIPHQADPTHRRDPLNLNGLRVVHLSSPVDLSSSIHVLQSGAGRLSIRYAIRTCSIMVYCDEKALFNGVIRFSTIVVVTLADAGVKITMGAKDERAQREFVRGLGRSPHWS